jgi:hypothetical protein
LINPKIDITKITKDLNLGPNTNLFEGVKKVGDNLLQEALKDPKKL